MKLKHYVIAAIGAVFLLLFTFSSSHSGVNINSLLQVLTVNNVTPLTAETVDQFYITEDANGNTHIKRKRNAGDVVYAGDPRPRVRIHPVLGAVIRQFYDDAKSRRLEIPSTTPKLRVARFTKDSLSGVGESFAVCKTLEGKTAEGKILKWKELIVTAPMATKLFTETNGAYLNEPDNIYLRKLVYHELGHCVLGKEDVVTPVTIMNSKYFPRADEDLATLWDSLVDEFFSYSPIS